MEKPLQNRATARLFDALDETSGTVAADSSGNGHDAAYIG